MKSRVAHVDPSPDIYILDPSFRVQEFWLVSFWGPGVVILTAQSRPQSYQQVFLVAWAAQVLVVEGSDMALVGDSLIWYIRSALILASCAFAISQT